MIRTLLVGLVGLAALVAISTPALADTPAVPPKVTIDTGTVVGAVVDQARVFKAIPYAAPPVGPLRWRPPQPAKPWTGERDATQDGPACPQVVYPGRYNEGGYQGPTSEDCLTLDVFAPLRASHAPVMVWIFGGGDVAGANSIAPNDGRFFARDGVILVAMNYRLGALGFFAHPALTKEASAGEPLANYGLMDQIAALQLGEAQHRPLRRRSCQRHDLRRERRRRERRDADGDARRARPLREGHRAVRRRLGAVVRPGRKPRRPVSRWPRSSACPPTPRPPSCAPCRSSSWSGPGRPDRSSTGGW